MGSFNTSCRFLAKCFITFADTGTLRPAKNVFFPFNFLVASSGLSKLEKKLVQRMELGRLLASAFPDSSPLEYFLSPEMVINDGTED